jgi:hypothetical protein
MSSLAPELAPPPHLQTFGQKVSALAARPNPAVDLWCGILLPLICFALDPGVVNGTIPTFLMSRFPLGAAGTEGSSNPATFRPVSPRETPGARPA